MIPAMAEARPVPSPSGDLPAGEPAATGLPRGAALLLRLLLVAFVVGTLLLTGSALFVDLHDVGRRLAAFTPATLLAMVAAVLANYLLRFVKWQYFLGRVGVTVPTGSSLIVFVSAFTMVLSPGKLGELMKAWLLRARFGIPLARTAPVVMAERITDLLGLIVLAAVGASRFAYGGATLAASLLLVVGGVVLITRPGFYRWCEDRLLADRPRLQRLRAPLRMLQDATVTLLSPASLLVTIPLSAVSWAGEGVALWLIFRALAVPVPDLLLVALFAHAFSSIVGALSFIPGGLFVTEGTLGVFFVMVGIGSGDAVTATLLIRAVTLWFAVVLGTFVFLVSGAAGWLTAAPAAAAATAPPAPPERLAPPPDGC